ncbi:MAG: RluA family pseudouridine synthase [Magnetococcus sp. DMHC-6]
MTPIFKIRTPISSSFERLTIRTEEEGERLDKALSLTSGHLSRTTTQRLIQSGSVQRECGKVITSVREKVKAGEVFLVQIPDPKPLDVLPEALPLRIIFEDRSLIVLDKQAGLTVHPSISTPQGTLVNALLHHCASQASVGGLSGIGGYLRPGIVHRIDKETSGLLVVAKTDQAHLGLAQQFKDHTVQRRYIALIKGSLAQPQGTIHAPIGRDPLDRKRMAVTEHNSRDAVTHYQVERPLPPFTLIQCRLETGRTHQIRVHMAHLGHPLLGDPVYARPFHPPNHWPQEIRERIIQFKRQALHAATLGFQHPETGQRLHFEAPLPEDFNDLLNALEFLNVLAPKGDPGFPKRG